MNHSRVLNAAGMSLLGALVLAAWQLLPDRFMGPFSAWNPHAILEFVIALFSISVMGNLAVHFLGPRFGLPLAGLVGGFASSTATIHAMGLVAKSRPFMADRAALGGVLSNLATLIQLAVLLQLLAPQLMLLLIQPLCLGTVAMFSYAAWVIFSTEPPPTVETDAHAALSFNWKSLMTLTSLVCGVSYVSAALNEAFGQEGLFVGAALSGLVDAHAIVPSMASMLMQKRLLPNQALMAFLIALTANTITKCLMAYQSGGLIYARKVSGGVCLTTAAVWLSYIST
jgi:uncharacterized membrane protein (DUF4010 family)